MTTARINPPNTPIRTEVETVDASPVDMYCDHGHRALASNTTTIRNDLLIVPCRVIRASPTSGRGRFAKVFSFSPGLPVRRRGAGVGITLSLLGGQGHSNRRRPWGILSPLAASSESTMNGWTRRIAYAAFLTFTAALAFAQAPGKAEALIDAAKSATGGAAWDKVTTWHESGTVAVGGLNGKYESWMDLTSLHNSSQYSLGPSTGSNGWDGKRAWTTDSSREVRIETSRETVAQAIQDAYRSGYAFYFPKRFPAERAYAGTRSADGKTYEAVKITPAEAEPFEVWFDPATHRVAREVQLTGGMPHTFIVSDFASFGALRLPKKTIDRVGNNPKFDTVTQVSTIDFSGPQSLARYAPPPPPPNNAQWPAGKDSVTVPFRLLNNHIYVMASINGKPPIPFVFDTGATDILEDSSAQRLGISVEGALPGGGFGDQIAAFGLARVKSVSLGGLTLPDQVFGTERSPGWIAVEGAQSDGLLGYEFVKRAVLAIDYAKRTLTFTRQEAFHPPKDVAAIPFTFDA